MTTSNNKYFVPVEITVKKPIGWFNYSKYEYKIYANENSQKFSKIKFIDIGGLIIGEHMPTKLNGFYDKVTNQAKISTIKAVTEIKNVVDGVADIAVSAAKEIVSDGSKTGGFLIGVFDKARKFTKSKLEKPKSKSSKEDLDNKIS